MKYVLSLLFLFNWASANDKQVVNELLCPLSPYVAKNMSKMNSQTFEKHIYANISLSEGQPQANLNVVVNKAINAYSKPDTSYLDLYTPYALENLLVHAAIFKNQELFDSTLQATSQICSDYYKKENAICQSSSHGYKISKEEKIKLCAEKSLRQSMDSVCSRIALVNNNKKIFFKEATRTFKTLVRIDYFDAKNKAKGELTNSNVGVALTSGLMILVGSSSNAPIQISQANQNLQNKNDQNEKNDLTSMCLSGQLIRPSQLVAK